jgi:2-oxoglutarate ferredoxin oxidoreductase subunit beta
MILTPFTPLKAATNGAPDPYKGLPSTLCKGCGHDSISSQIIAVARELGINPRGVIKISGIGCSSKTPAYWLGQSHGLNGVHGRMPSMATGAALTNRHLLPLAVSGDGDTSNIGLGQFKHLMRRNLHMIYIVENNGVYGLTKGQFSATSDFGMKTKHAGTNILHPLNLCIEAIVAGATFVARSFSGDAKQVRSILKAAFSHRGMAMIDIISPCVTFNNAEDSTKSYAWGRDHEEPIHEISLVPTTREEIEVEYAEGEERLVEMFDGSFIKLKKLGAADHDPTSRGAAIDLLLRAQDEMTFLTGIFYVNQEQPSFQEVLNIVETPLAQLTAEQLRPSPESLAKIMEELK